ncbi:porin family protein [Neolewinella sp.]|uniref:porin family protein n=1 Tax=Neolewinella sp. TaxID=2993543 RepID=UPI003B52687C
MRLLLIALLALTTSAALIAQTTIGLRAGYGQSALRSGETFDVVTEQTGWIAAPSLGVFAELPLSDLITLRPGLEYNRRGTSVGLTQGVDLFGVRLPVGARARTTFDYLEAPLLVQLNLPTEGTVQPYALVGPSVGYALSGKLRTSARALIDFRLSTTDINLEAINYERLHVGLVAGAGLKAQVGIGAALFLEARYEHGLTQPYNVPLVRDGVGFQGWNVGVGVSFAL